MLPRARQSGFALLLTLVLVLIAGATLAGIARHSGTRALDARTQTEALQRRWAVTSARDTLLRRVPIVLDQAERGERIGDAAEPTRKPVAAIAIDCRLADLAFRIVAADEQAKLDVNQLVAVVGVSDAPRLLREMLADTSPRPDVRLRFSASFDSNAREVGSFGQVFADASPRMLVGGSRGNGPAELLTCWTNGQLNVRRASDEAIETLCTRALGPRLVSDLLRIRQDDPFAPIEAMRRELGAMDKKQAEQFGRLLTDESASHSLWMIAHGRQRHWYALSIGEGVDRIGRRTDFEW